MKKILIIILLLLAVVSVYNYFQNQPNSVSSNLNNSKGQTVSPTIGSMQQRTLLFVPYWTVNSDMAGLSDYSSLLYFGISADKNGIDRDEPGYKNLQEFVNASESQQKYLVIRLIDGNLDSEILENSALQKKIINQSIEIAKEYGFDGIVLDFEIPALAFQSVTDGISSFYKNFYAQVKKSDLVFLITVYGDTYYRARPYDLKILGQNSDQVLIMAYDFHKARGNPGPNFPLNGREQYGYDFSQMIEDFTKEVPSEKLGVVFGLFGYDWEVNNKNESKTNGQPLSYLQIKQQFLDNCEFDSCKKMSNQDLETQIEYKDGSEKHIIWFEDPNSVQKKIEFLKGKGISTIGYWAYTYF